MNDTAGANGLVPTILLFGDVPKPLPNLSPFPKSRDHHQAAITARTVFENIIAQQRVRTAATKRPSPAAMFRFAPKQPVYVYREKEKCWRGPHLVRHVDGKGVWVDIGKRSGSRQFNIPRVKPV